MTSVAEVTPAQTVDWRIIVGGGAKMGVATAVGVTAFALLSRTLTGTGELVVQMALILLAAIGFSYGPSLFFRPKDVDTIAWVSLIGLLGALFFTFIDTVLLRPLNLYPWRWDEIGGGSGFWYIPVWWMGAAFVSWLGAWILANESNDTLAFGAAIIKSLGIGALCAGAIAMTGLLPFTPATLALGLTFGLVLHVPLSAMMRKG